jgi:hypothetical protein
MSHVNRQGGGFFGNEGIVTDARRFYIMKAKRRADPIYLYPIM